MMTINYKILLIILILSNILTNKTFAQAGIEPCGAVSKIEGESCKTAKIYLDLKGCEPTLGVVTAKVNCNDKDITATYQTTKYNYRLALESSETWGKQSLAAKGKIWRAIRKSYKSEERSVSEVAPAAQPVVTAVAPAVAKSNLQAEEPAKISINASGVSWAEYESSDRFGFSGTSGRSNFSSSETQPESQQNMSLNVRLNLDAGGPTSRIYSTLSIGDIYFGDTASGGGTGQQKGDAIRLRDLYLSHKSGEHLKFDVGVMPTSADPRGFIYSDDLAVVAFYYQGSSHQSKLWFGDASRTRPSHSSSDRYYGAQSALTLNDSFVATPFVVYRTLSGETFKRDNGDGLTYDSDTGATHSYYLWAGGNAVYTFGHFGFDLTGIYNSARTKFANFVEQDAYSAYLVDLKAKYKAEGSKFEFAIEGLATPGAKNVKDSDVTVIGKRRAFASPVETSYLLTIATSDGADEAPGSKKEAISTASLATPEGLNLVIGTVKYDFNDELSSFVRYGHITSAIASAQGSCILGDEFNYQLLFKTDANSSLQFDYAYLSVGSFYTNPKDAQLFAARYKVEF